MKLDLENGAPFSGSCFYFFWFVNNLNKAELKFQVSSFFLLSH